MRVQYIILAFYLKHSTTVSSQNCDEFAGKTFQLAGPAEYTFKEVAEYVSDVTMVRSSLVDVPVPVASAVGSFVEQLVQPVLTADHVRSISPLSLYFPLSICYDAPLPLYSIFVFCTHFSIGNMSRRWPK